MTDIIYSNLDLLKTSAMIFMLFSVLPIFARAVGIERVLNKSRQSIVFFVFAFCSLGQAIAVVEITEFESQQQEALYKELIAELRCPKCQNQNLMDSDAPIAADLRRKTKSLIDQGKTGSEIKSYMLERYGDFVLYKPRFTLATAFLWLGPFVLLVFVVFILFKRIKRKQEAELFKVSKAEDESTRVKVRNLMASTPPLDSSSE